MEKQSDSHSISVDDRNEKLADNSLGDLNLADETEVSKKSHELKETSDIKEDASKNIDEPKKTESTKGITLKNISYQYKKQDSGEEKYAIKDISLAIEPGEFVAIIGRTGSGKSTLIQHFNGLFQPKSGAYFFNGENIWEKKYDLKKLRQKVALLSLIHI